MKKKFEKYVDYIFYSPKFDEIILANFFDKCSRYNVGMATLEDANFYYASDILKARFINELVLIGEL